MSEPIEVEFKPCGCGVLVGEECDCAEWVTSRCVGDTDPARVIATLDLWHVLPGGER